MKLLLLITCCMWTTFGDAMGNQANSLDRYNDDAARQKKTFMKADSSRLYKDVQFLTSIAPARNSENIRSLNMVADHIFKEFESAGGKPEIQEWEAQGKKYRNIIVSYNADKADRLVVGAHYDVAGDQPGADDNASGVSGLLELVRMTFKNKPGLNYRIDFVAYSLEEPPYFGSDKMGSHIHAKSLFDNKVNVIGMICLEMIGYFSDKPGSQPYPSEELRKLYPDVANYIIVVGIEQFSEFNKKVHGLMASGSDVDVQIIDFPSGDGLAGLSDQRNYWKFGYKALMINDTAFIRNPHYHLKSDTITTLDFGKMAAVVNSSYKAIIGM